MGNGSHRFGGDWTQKKLDALKSYLTAYAQAMKNQRFETWYIDAFAGTGYRESKTESDGIDVLPEMVEPEAASIRDGSVAIALQVEPPFTHYVFIETNPTRLANLRDMASEHPQRSIEICEIDCNCALRELCSQKWRDENRRGVVFLDPYGMQVEWQTVESIAATRAIDVWVLFPLAVAVNRLLRKDLDKIDPWARNKLDLIFGTDEWRGAFYAPEPQMNLFDPEPGAVKRTDFEKIECFYVDRLRTVFPAVASKSLWLRNSVKIPLYSFVFACANPDPKAKKLALKLAEHILKMES